MEFTLLFAAALGIASMWLAIRLTPGLSERVEDPFGVLLGASMVGLFAGRLGAMILTGTNPITHLPDILLVRGGVDTGVASVAVMAALWWAHKKNFLTTADALTASALIGLAGWQAGCLLRGACLGTSTNVPWAIASESGIGRHPTEIYAAIGFLIAAWLLRRASPPAGRTAALGLIAASAVRLATEPLRPTLGNGATWWYVTGLAVGAVALIAVRNRDRQSKAQDDADVR